jgi:hypothetical protein
MIGAEQIPHSEVDQARSKSAATDFNPSL